MPKTIVTKDKKSELAYLLPVGVSYLGTPIFENVVFPSGNYKIINTDGSSTTIEYDELIIDDAKLIVTRTTNIVKSQINGFDGSVKEYINKDDYSISLEGTFSNIIGGLPYDEITGFAALMNSTEPIKIESKLLNSIYQIQSIVVTDFEMGNGHSMNNVPISIKMESDEQDKPDSIYQWFPNVADKTPVNTTPVNTTQNVETGVIEEITGLNLTIL